MSPRRCIPLLFILQLLPAAAFAQAVVEGRVELPKTHSTPVVNKRYEVISKGGIVSTDPPRAVVYVEGAFGKPSALPVRQMVQKDLRFVTPLLPVQLGTKVEFPNLDDTSHNIFSYSPAKRFDLGRYRSDEKPIPSQVFDKAGLVTLRCDIHEHMRGLILVIDSPHFVITEADGRFRLGGLPAGHYVVKAWVDSRRTLEHPVDMKSGATLHVDFP